MLVVISYSTKLLHNMCVTCNIVFAGSLDSASFTLQILSTIWCILQEILFGFILET